MLTTVDNPYNYYTDFKEWYEYDRRMGHFTLEYLGRVVVSSPELSVEDQEAAIDEAIDDIIKEDVTGLYTRCPEPQ